MRYVPGPQQANFMVHTVMPVVEKVVGHKGSDPYPQAIARQGRGAVGFEYQSVNAQFRQLGERPNHLAQ